MQENNRLWCSTRCQSESEWNWWNEDQNDTLAFVAGLLRIPLLAEPSPSFSESVEGADDTGIPLSGLGQAEEQEWSFRSHSLKSETLPIDGLRLEFGMGSLISQRMLLDVLFSLHMYGLTSWWVAKGLQHKLESLLWEIDSLLSDWFTCHCCIKSSNLVSPGPTLLSPACLLFHCPVSWVPGVRPFLQSSLKLCWPSQYSHRSFCYLLAVHCSSLGLMSPLESKSLQGRDLRVFIHLCSPSSQHRPSML